MDVVIIPPPRLGGIYDHNRIWGRQFVAANTSQRRLVELQNERPISAIAAIRQAAGIAGRDGRVLLLIGHGGALGGANDDVGTFDLAPHRQFRLTQEIIFFNPASDSAQSEANTLQSAASLPSGPRAQFGWCQDRFGTMDRRFCAQYVRQLRGTATAIGEAQQTRRYYEQVAQIFHAQPVAEVVALTCNVGNATAFVDELSADWGVPVRAYRRRVSSNQDQSGQVRLYLEGDAVDQGSNTERARTEIPATDYYVGRGRRARTGGPRLRPAVP